MRLKSDNIIMDELQHMPLILCTENAMGEEVSLQIEPNDNFQSFLTKAKLLLGSNVDINSVTNNQPVALTDNIYEYLINSENNQATAPNRTKELEDDLLYILNDGTQIHASQIHFDNDEPPIDLTKEKLPFVKYTEDGSDDDVPTEGNIVNYNIIDSPVPKWSNRTGSPKNFVSNIPFKLVCNNTTGFEYQFTKYLESKNKTYTTLNPVINNNKSPVSLIQENFKKYDDFKEAYTREDILNMFKDSPVNSLPFEYTECKHVRKTDPSRVRKSVKPAMPYIDMDGVIVGETENQSCNICGNKVDYTNKLYLFDNKDQKLHRTQRKLESQLKIICEACLEENFRQCRMKNANQFLETDEFLIIRNNQQYIYKKVKDFTFRNDVISSKVVTNNEFVNVEIGSDGEIVTKPVNTGDVILHDNVLDESSSDVEIIDELDTIIENLDEADEEVKEFLGKNEKVELDELKCRFCHKEFSQIVDASEHCDAHKHKSEGVTVYPCPLCDYGYEKLKWLKAHVKTAHVTVRKEELCERETREDRPEEKTGGSQEENPEKVKEDASDQKTNVDKIEVKMEIKHEEVDISDDEIWIVRTADDEAEEQLKKLFVKSEETPSIDEKYPSCENCNQLFPSIETLAAHKCRRPKKRVYADDTNSICVPTKEDFIKRAQGRPVNSEPENSFTVGRRKSRNQNAAESKIVTCHDCNESFTSKVRLKFHMQFHENTNLLTDDGKYKCHLCEDLFDNEGGLFDHVHFQHHKHNRWLCPVKGCGKTFYLRATLTKHSRTHTDTRRYVCVTCGKRFLDKQTLDEHGVTHLQIKPFQCHICFKQLTRRSRLRMHLRAHEEELAPRLVYVCVVCTRAFKDSAEAKDHAAKSSECVETFANELKEETQESALQLSPTSGMVREAVKCNDSPKLYNPIKREVSSEQAKPLLSQLPDEARCIIRVVEIEKAFRCEYCEDVFYLEDGLNKHRLIHKGVKNPFTCHICKVNFATYSRCTTHKTTHGFYKRPPADGKKCKSGELSQSSTGILGYGDFPVVKHFLCEDCGRSYLHWTYLQVHRRMKHPNDNFFHQCNQCEMSFPNSWSVAYHRKKMHGKANPDDPETGNQRPKTDYRIPCRDCNEVLPNKNALYKHRKDFHSDITHAYDGSGDLFVCGNCGKQYGNRSGLDEHLSTHIDQNGYPTCLRCNSTFTHTGDLQMHLKEVHNVGHGNTTNRYGRASYGQPFPSFSTRGEHYGISTAEGSYPGDVGGAGFKRTSAVRNQRAMQGGARAWSCDQCLKRFRNQSDLGTHLRLKHPSQLTVVEVSSSNPSIEDIAKILSQNNIHQDRVIDITKMSFSKGTTSVIPTNTRALSMLSNVSRVQVPFRKPIETPTMANWYGCDSGIVKSSAPNVVQIAPERTDGSYEINVDLPKQELTEINIQQLLRDGMIMSGYGSQTMQIQLDDTVLLQ